MDNNKKKLALKLGLGLSALSIGAQPLMAEAHSGDSFEINMGEIQKHTLMKNEINGSKLEQLYEDVKAELMNDKPRNALKSCDILLKEALNEKNFPYYVEAKLTKFNIEKSLDNTLTVEGLIADLNQLYDDKWLTGSDRILLDMVLYNLYRNNNYSSNLDESREQIGDISIGQYNPGWSNRQFLSIEARLLSRVLTNIQQAETMKADDCYPIFRQVLRDEQDVLMHSLRSKAHITSEQPVSYYILEVVDGFVEETVDDAVTIEGGKNEDVYSLFKRLLTKASEKLTDKQSKFYIDYILLNLDYYSNRIQVETFLESLKKIIIDSKSLNLSSTLFEKYIAEQDMLPDIEQNEQRNNENLKLGLEVLNSFEDKESYGYLNTLETIRGIIKPELGAKVLSRFPVGSPIDLKLSDSFNPDKFNSLSISIIRRKDNLNGSRKEKGEIVFKKTFEASKIKKEGDNFVLHLMKELPAGCYEINLSASTKVIVPEVGAFSCDVANAGFVVTNIFPVRLSNGKMDDIRLLDFATGKPIRNAEVKVYDEHWNRPHERYDMEEKFQLKTDAEGWCRLKEEMLEKNNRYYATFSVKGDDPNEYLTIDRNSYTEKYDADFTKNQLFLFTDRSSYRPGQKMMISGFAYKAGYFMDKARVRSNEKLTITINDVNGEVVKTLEVVTDKNGDFHADVMLPTRTLTGRFTISSENFVGDFYVEEYKRPTFEVTIEEPQGVNEIGKEVDICGSARLFSGTPMMGARGSATISVSKLSRYWWFSREEKPVVLEERQFAIDENGSFELPVKLQLTDNLERDYKNNPDDVFIFNIDIKIISSNGEVRTENKRLVVGRPQCRISVHVDKSDVRFDNRYDKVGIEVSETVYINKDSFEGKTLSEVLKTNVTSPFGVPEVSRLAFVLKNQSDKTAASWVMKDGKFEENAQDPTLSKLHDGNYSFEISIETTDGLKAEKKGKIVVFDRKSRKIETENDLTVITLDSDYGNGHKPSFLVGTNFSDATLYYDVLDDYKVVSSEKVSLKKGVLSNVDLNIKNLSRPVYQLRFYMVKNGRLYAETYTLKLSEEKREINIKQKSFRKIVDAGTEETWSFSLTDNEGKPVSNASVAAFMFDASLLSFHPYSLPTIKQKLFPHLENISPYANGSFWRSIFPYFKSKPIQVPFLQDYYFSQGLDMYSGMIGDRLYAPAKDMNPNHSLSGTVLGLNMKADAAYAEELQVSASALDEPTVDINQKEADKNAVRKDFAETAFFFPTLSTDDKGICSWSFKLPQSITAWKLYVVSHTDNLAFGEESYDVKTVKEFMVMSNMPRFIRMGDNGTVSATIYNMSDKEVSPTVRMELFDPQSGRILHVEKKSLVISPKGSDAVTFPLEAQGDGDMLGVRIIADGKTFSDGEERILPQLTNVEPVHTSIPVMLLPGEEKVIDLNEYLPKTLPSNAKVTINKDGSLLWPILRTLPSITSPHHDSFSLAGAIYANTIASYILNEPSMEKFVSKAKESRPDTSSTLRTSSEIYDMIAGEMPWIREAKAEEANASQIITLLEGTSNTASIREMVEELSKLQNPDGGYSWLPSMRSSYYATEYVVLQSLRLKEMTGESYFDLKDAVRFLQRKNMEELRRLMKMSVAKRYLPESFVSYAYIKTMDMDESGEGRKDDVLDYTLKFLFQKMREHKLPTTSLPKAAIIANFFGEKKLALDAVESLRQYLTFKEGQGAFFAMTDVNPYYYYDARYPLHIATMEAFKKVVPDLYNDKELSKVFNQMKMWLISQKRVQTWPSTPETSDIVYGLFISPEKESGKDLIDSLTESMEPSTETTAVPTGRKIKISNPSKGIMWGSVFVDYQRVMGQKEVQKVSKNQPMILSEKAYKAVVKDGEEKLLPLNEGDALSIGDEVRIIYNIKIDRAMDFVVLTNGRSAAAEPIGQLTGYRYGGDTWYYFEAKDASTNFFMDTLVRGSYQLEFSQRIVRQGTYHSSKSILRSAYSKDFSTEVPGNTFIVK